MGDTLPEPPASPDPLALPTRAARVLIGWLTPGQGALALSGRVLGDGDNTALLERVQAARDVVAAREAGVEQDGLLQDPPPELNATIARLQAQPNAAPFIAEGWQVKIADL